jgi:cephalosporin hydroxylase
MRNRVRRRWARRSETFSVGLEPPHDVVEAFHRLFYGSGPTTVHENRWLGHRVLKCPLDLWVYQELLAETRPDLIVETGTAHGGSALFLASICELLGNGHVVSVDVTSDPDWPRHPRITYVRGSSIDDATVDRVRELIPSGASVMVDLDADHSAAHVRRELDVYGDLVTVGSYLVVEDTNLNGHPVMDDHGPGPSEAVASFLAVNTRFQIDRRCEKFLLTFNPGGFLRRLR